LAVNAVRSLVESWQQRRGIVFVKGLSSFGGLDFVGGVAEVLVVVKKVVDVLALLVVDVDGVAFDRGVLDVG
jgi:hypothetical protein